MSAGANLDHLTLLKFGVAVPPQHREEVLKLIKTTPAYKQEFELIKNSLNTMVNQDDFLEAITGSHSKIADIPENAKVIMKRDTTYQIRAINPEHITSLTERAFFNSFSLERIILNDQEEQNTRKDVQDREQQRNHQNGKPQKKIEKDPNDDQDKCICGKVIPGSEWILCNNENKCRGSEWYHLQCAGVKIKEEELSTYIFICESCRRPSEEDKESESSQKKFKYNESK